MTSTHLTFGIYPLSPAGTPTGLAVGPEDDYGKIGGALRELRGASNTLSPRTYRDIPAAVERPLRHLREKSLVAAGIPVTVPIRVTENGWPTGQNPFTGHERTYEQQANILEAVIRTVYRLRMELHISHYILFGLRDADSGKPDLFHQFGIMRDDYTPKPAFTVYQRLIRELGRTH
ncbi:hypothetical protein ACLD72_027790 [Paenibacillus sp. TH7-28]